MEPDKAEGDATQAGSIDGDVGDVETAGETTAAAAINGDTTDTRPVGTDTLVKVADTPESSGSDNE